MIQLPCPSRRQATLGLLGLFALPLQASPAAPSRRLRIVRSDWPPYVYMEGERPVGLDVELIEAVLQRIGYRLELVAETPRRRRAQMLAAGELDLVPAATVQEDNQQQTWYTSTYRHELIGLLGLEAQREQFAGLRAFSDLITRRIPVLVPKYRTGGELDGLIERLRPAGLAEPYDSARRGMAMLQRGRASLIIGDIPTMLHLGKLEGTPVVRAPLPEQRAPVSLMLSRKTVSADLLAQINASMAALEADGTLPAIRKRYGF